MENAFEGRKMAIEILTDDDRSNMRLALEDRIIYLLGFHREWKPEAEATFSAYNKIGGYLVRETFEELSGIRGK